MKIIIDEYNGFTSINVTLLDDSGSVIESMNDRSFEVAESYILRLHLIYNLPDDTILIDNVYDNDNNITSSDQQTMKDFLEI